MICKNCGTENKKNSVYCKNCGASLNTSNYEQPKSNSFKIIMIIGIIILAGGLCGAAMYFVPKLLDGDLNGNTQVVQVEISSSESVAFETSTEEETTVATTIPIRETTSRQMTESPTEKGIVDTKEETEDVSTGDQKALEVAEKVIKAIIESYTPDFVETVPKCYLDLYGTDRLGKYVSARLQSLEGDLASYYGDGDVSYQIEEMDSLTVEEMQEREVSYIQGGMDIKITDGRRLQVKTYKEDEESWSQITIIKINGEWYFDLLNSN